MGDRSNQLDIVQALLFYPRGGAAQVIRYLTASLVEQGANCQIISGSRGEPGDFAHAPTFFQSLDVLPVDYGPALAAADQGRDPLTEPVPLHPSYEDQTNAPDRIFTSVDPETAAYLEERWSAMLARRVASAPDLFHLHHLTPLQAAVRVNWPDVPLIGHIHGTELKMLTGIRSRLAIARKLGLDLEHDCGRFTGTIEANLDRLDEDEQRIARQTRWEQWRYARFWQERLRQYASMCDALIVLTSSAGDQVTEMLGFDRQRIHPVPNGVDIDRFRPEHISPDERLARWKQWLVDDPRGWDETGIPGTVRYSISDLNEWFVDQNGELSPVLMYVGRFMGMKRVPMLIRAYQRAQADFKRRAPLVIWGGNPGEWEHEHPVTVARQIGVSGVFFIGWRGHQELPSGLNAADLMVAPSTNEPFGQVYLEAMACQLPVIGTQSGGPPSFINTRSDALDGWLVPPDDEAALAAALVEAVNNPDERLARGRNALQLVRSAYSWTRVAGKVREIYDNLIDGYHRPGVVD